MVKRLYEPLAAVDRERLKVEERRQFWVGIGQLALVCVAAYACLWFAAAL